MFYSTPLYFNCPTNGGVATMPYVSQLAVPPRITVEQRTTDTIPPIAVPREGPTYPYDGGPRNPVPLPRTEPAPTSRPPAPAPGEGRVVSVKPEPARFAYPAYGNPQGTTSFAEARVVPVKTQVVDKSK